MTKDFFKVRPIEWVDLPFSNFDSWGDRVSSEAVVSTPYLSIPLRICEKRRDEQPYFKVSINCTSLSGEIDSLEGAKIYAQQMLQANIASLIVPVYTAQESKILHDTEQAND